MPVFSYKAINASAAAVAGTVTADSVRQARDQLRERGLSVAEVAEVRAGKASSFLERRQARRGREEVQAFVSELATLLGSGIPLLSALDTLARQHHGSIRVVIQGLREQVAASRSLADAMAERPAWFDDLAASIVRVGENTGTLETAVSRLAQFQEKSNRLRGRVLTALIYPAVVATIGLAVAIFLMTYVVPQLLSTLTEAGRELPLATRIVKAASDGLLRWWWAILAAVAALAALARAVLRSPRGRLAADRLILKLPVIGDLVRKENTFQMAAVMAGLLRSGLVFDEAIRITRRTIRNQVFRRVMDDYEAAVVAGRDIAGPLEASGVFSPMVIHMLAVGQQSGQLEEMLERLSAAYDQQVTTATQRLTALLEPLLIVLLAVLVGFIAFATVLPILEMSHVY